MHTTHLSACLHRNYSNLARKVHKKKTTKRHYRDNIEYRDILTHDNRHQLFLILPIPTPGILTQKHRSMCEKKKKFRVAGAGRSPIWPRKKFGTLHEFACHPCAGAMLIFSVSFQF